jgi:hypothetical protein
MHTHYFSRRKNQKRGATRTEWAWPTWPRNLAAWGLPVRTSGPVSTSPFNHAFISPEKGSPYFSQDLSMSRQRQSLCPLPEGSDPAALELWRRGKSPPSSPHLLLAIRGGLSIAIITKIMTISSSSTWGSTSTPS